MTDRTKSSNERCGPVRHPRQPDARHVVRVAPSRLPRDPDATICLRSRARELVEFHSERRPAMTLSSADFSAACFEERQTPRIQRSKSVASRPIEIGQKFDDGVCDRCCVVVRLNGTNDVSGKMHGEHLCRLASSSLAAHVPAAAVRWRHSARSWKRARHGDGRSTDQREAEALHVLTTVRALTPQGVRKVTQQRGKTR